jgi:serine/threonine-protein kinase RsbW
VNLETKEFSLESRIESVEKAAGEAAMFAKQSGFSEDALHSIDMAVREAVANAVKHGNKLDETKQVEIAFRDSADGFELVIRDFGTGFALIICLIYTVVSFFVVKKHFYEQSEQKQPA